MSKPHNDSNISPRKGGSITQLLKRALGEFSEKDQNQATMSSNGSSPRKQIDSPMASIPTPFQSLQEPPISSSSNDTSNNASSQGLFATKIHANQCLYTNPLYYLKMQYLMPSNASLLESPI